MKRTYFLFLVFLVVSISVVVAGCSLLPNTSLEILQHSLEKTVVGGELTAQIVGAARNDGSSRIDYAEVKGSFYDENEALLATGFAKTIYQEGDQKGESFTLAPGQIWDFTILYLAPESEPSYPSLGVLECVLEKDSSQAALVGTAQNDGNVTLAFAKLTGHFLDANGGDLTPVGTTTITDLEVGEIWDFTIYFPRYDVDLVEDGYAKIEDPDKDLQAVEQIDEVDHVSVAVGVVRGTSIMP